MQPILLILSILPILVLGMSKEAATLEGPHSISHSPQSLLVSKRMTLFENAYTQVAGLVRTFEEHRDQLLALKNLSEPLDICFCSAYIRGVFDGHPWGKG